MDGVRDMWRNYIADEAARLQPEASPAQAETLAGLAPALVIGAEHDYLLGEGDAYARRLKEAGVPTATITYPGTIHGFFSLLGAFDEAHDAVAKAAEALRTALA
jgi:acetyl esterase